MAQTKAQIATRVLLKHKRLPIGQVADDNLLSQVKTEYDELYQELKDDGIVNWAATDNIPDNVVRPIYLILLGRTADNFGRPDKWSAYEDVFKQRILRILAPTYVHTPTKFENH